MRSLKFWVVGILAAGLVLLVAVPGWGQVGPFNQVNTQGIITEKGGDPVQGNINMVIKIWDAYRGGNMVWTESLSPYVTDGIFNLKIGDVSHLDDVDWSPVDKRYFLEITIDGVALEPRQELTAVPFAIMAKNLKGGKIEAEGDPAIVGRGSPGDGVFGMSTDSYGVHGQSTNSDGVHGMGKRSGVYGYGMTEGHGVWGQTQSTGPDAKAGVYGVNIVAADGGPGVKGESTSGYGVYGISSAGNKYGVYGVNDALSGNRVGVYGEGKIGVFADSLVENGSGIYAINRAVSGDGKGVEAVSASGYGVYGTGIRGVIGFRKDYPFDHTGIYGMLGGYRLTSGMVLDNPRAGAYGQIDYNNYGYLGYHKPARGAIPEVKAGVYGYSADGPGVYGSSIAAGHTDSPFKIKTLARTFSANETYDFDGAVSIGTQKNVYALNATYSPVTGNDWHPVDTSKYYVTYYKDTGKIRVISRIASRSYFKCAVIYSD